ncbi:MASE3 domain-containing protein [Pseudodesulfovibrio senegalensis]|nr:MASE3 domain-containing protein [Pseudodesulfovibrio senegalensis]
MTRKSLLTVLCGLVILGVLLVMSRSNYLFFHCLAQTISIAVAWAVFVVSWNSRRVVQNNYMLFLGIGFLFCSSLDFLHTLAFTGMGVFPNHGPNLHSSLWLGARFIQTGALLIAPVFVRRSLNAYGAFACFALVTAALAGAIFTGVFPVCWVEGYGPTHFRTFSEYAIAAGMLAAAFKLYTERDQFSTTVLRMLMAYILFTAVQEVCFAQGGVAGGPFMLAGHLLKILAVYCLYEAMIVTGIARPQEVLYWRLKQSEEALRKSRERFKTVADFTFDWEYWLDENGQCVWVSPSAKRVTGYDAHDFYKDPDLFTKIMHPDDRDTPLVCAQDTNGEEPPCTRTFRIIRKDGTLCWIGHVCQPVYDSSGKWRGRRGSNRDITELCKAEALRKDVERIARHDLKSPLSGIISAVGVLQDAATIPEQQRMLLQKMESEARNTLNMVDMSLTLLKIEENRYEPDAGPQDAIKIIRAVLDDLAPTMRTKSVRAEVVVDPEPDDTIFMGEELLCRSLLGNLIKNAVEASPENHVVSINIAGPLSTCTVTICNMGEVPEPMRDRFFHKYSTHGKRKGMGLGTYSARLLARVQGGDVVLNTSEPGRTMVTVTLPRH